MKMYEVLDLAGFLNSIGDFKVPVKTAYKINKLKDFFKKDIEFYQNKFEEIVNTYAKKGEDGNWIFTEDHESIAIEDGKEKECNEKVLELRTVDVELPNVTFTIEELESLELTLDQMSVLMPFIVE